MKLLLKEVSVLREPTLDIDNSALTEVVLDIPDRQNFKSTPEKLTFVADNSITPRSLGVRFKDVLNVRDFKLPTDPDDTLSFQRALDKMKELGGYVSLYIPSGKFVISKALYVEIGNVEIYGNSAGTLIEMPLFEKGEHFAGWGLYQVFRVGIIGQQLQNIHIRDFQISQNSTKERLAGKGFCRMFSVHSVDNFVIEGITAEHIGHFFASQNCHNFSIRHNTIVTVCANAEDNHGDACLASWDGCTDFNYSHNHMVGTDPYNGKRGYHKAGTSITGDTTGTGANLTKDWTVHNNTIKGFDTFGIWCDGRKGNHQTVHITDNKIYGNNGYGIRLEDTHFFLIEGNTLRDNGLREINVQLGATTKGKGTACCHGSITGNNIQRGGAGVGIYLDAECNANMVTNNKIRFKSGNKANNKGVHAQEGSNYNYVARNMVVNGQSFLDKGNNYGINGSSLVPAIQSVSNLVTATCGTFIVTESEGVVIMKGVVDYEVETVGSYTNLLLGLASTGYAATGVQTVGLGVEATGDVVCHAISQETTTVTGLVEGHPTEAKLKASFFPSQKVGKLVVSVSYIMRET